MHGAAYDGLVYVNITVSYLQVESTSGVSTYPRLVMNGRPLAAEIGQGHEIASTAFLAFGETGILHEATSQHINLKK